MKNYYRIMLGQKSVYAREGFEGNFIGAGWLPHLDLKPFLNDDQSAFNRVIVARYLQENPDKTKMSAALACGMLYSIVKKINIGDIVLCPNGSGLYLVGEVTGDYEYAPEKVLPHRRAVRWFGQSIPRVDMSDGLRHSAGAIGALSTITRHAVEIEQLLGGQTIASIITTDETIEDAATFALEKHLEDFLVQNWAQTEFGKRFDIFSDDGELVGQQYMSDTGPIDILAVSKDKKEILVVELKRGRASDVVVGQIQRYMGYVQSEVASAGQVVRGAIVALEDDLRIRRALSVAENIEFYTYKVSFSLEKQ